MEKISLFLSHVLDNIGYGPQMVSFRRDAWQNYALIENSMKYHKAKRHLIVAGSKSEGTTSFYENDIDHMFVLTDVICAEEVEGISDSSSLSVFQTDMHDTPPGYVKLKLEHLNGGPNIDLIRDSLFRGPDGHKYISSTFYVAEQEKEVQYRQSKLSAQNGVVYKDTVGPALPVTSGSLSADIVSGFFYNRPKYLQVWSKRCRQQEWPPSDVIKDIATGHGQVVPIGCTLSDSQFQDWRMCFVDSELKLLQTFNHTQIKLYILLKLLTKHVLNDVSKDVTSYIVKNVCFWMAELLPVEIFREDRLLPLLRSSLQFLKRFVDQNNLPYYMIPERNLLAGKLQYFERQKLSSLIMGLILEGPSLLLRCPKMQEAMWIMYQSPEQLCVYSKKRDELEILKLRHVILSIAKEYGADTGDLCNSLRHEMADIVLPDRRVLEHAGADIQATIMQRLQQCLS